MSHNIYNNKEEEIIKKNIGLVYSIASKYKNLGIDTETLLQAGMIGIVEAHRRYNKDIAKFSTYSTFYIKYKMREEIREEMKNRNKISTEEIKNESTLDFNPEFRFLEEQIRGDIIEKISKLNKREKYIIETYFGINNNRKISLKEIGRMLNISKERVRKIKDKALEKLKRMYPEMREYILQ